MDLSVVWAILILTGVALYVFMDGFDLGIGILLPLVKDKDERDVLINTVAPVWDGNETWLVLGGAALFGAFPLAYAVILDALTIPLLLMLLGLIFRGVAFEFRFKAVPNHRPFWDKAFIFGSLVSTFFQGVTVGSFIQGFNVIERQFVGGYFDWFTPFSLFCGLGLIIAYALLGSTWLIMKTEHQLQREMQKITSFLIAGFFCIVLILSIVTPLLNQRANASNLFTTATLLISVILTALLSYRLFKSCSQDVHYLPFILTLLLISIGLLNFVLSIWPYIIPTTLTIWDAAAPKSSQWFALAGAIFILPVVLVYTGWSYYVFRGKVKAGEGYHH